MRARRWTAREGANAGLTRRARAKT
jgi:hypothetical protein